MSEFNQEYDPSLDEFETTDEAPDLPPVVNDESVVNPEVANTAAKTEEPAKVQTFEDDFQRLAFEKLSEQIAAANSIIGTSNAANGSKDELREQLTEESTDPEVVAAREARDEAVALLESLIEPQVNKIVGDVAENQKQLEEKIKEAEGKIKPGLNYYKKVYGDDAADFLPKLSRLKGARLFGAATGGRRIRGFSVIVTTGDEVNEYDAFSKAAKALDKDTSVLQDAFFEAAKTTDLKSVPDKVKFQITFTSTDDEGASTEETADILAYRTAADED